MSTIKAEDFKSDKELVDHLNGLNIIQKDFLYKNTPPLDYGTSIIGFNSDYDEENKDYMTTLYICEILDRIVGVKDICCIFDNTKDFIDYEYDLEFYEIKPVTIYVIKWEFLIPYKVEYYTN